MMLERIAQGAVIVASVIAALQADAAGVRYYDEDAVPDPRAIAQILTEPQPDVVQKSRPSWLAPKIAKSDARPRKVAAIHRDPTAAREKRINALAQAAVDEWRFRRTHGNARVARAVYGAPAQQTAASPPALAIGIHFAKESTEIPRSARTGLDAVAQGIRLSSVRHALLIEGHTSATGNPARDLRLSRLRAESVKRYLVSRHAIAAERLRVVGLGAQRPLNAKEPRAAENQRVQLRVLI
jgi:outer membrane protein OmpA-like peptidoglycan-associated protein